MKIAGKFKTQDDVNLNFGLPNLQLFQEVTLQKQAGPRPSRKI